MDKQMTFGAIPSPYDPRDYSVKIMAPAKLENLEITLDDVPIYNQGAIGNCVMQALSSGPHLYYDKKMGVTFGYGRWRTTMNTGMRPNEAVNGFVKEGIPTMDADSKLLEMPEAHSYANNNASRLLADAAPRKGWTWARLNSVDDIRATLVQAQKTKGIHIIVCLPYCAIINDVWRVDGTINGYHEMAIKGCSDSKQMFRLRNSWGTAKDLSISGTKDGYVYCKYEDIMACNDVIAIFPPEKEEEKKDDDIVNVRRTLRLKTPFMQGDDVSYCQTRLKVHGQGVTADGTFGPKTDKAVKAFQAVKKLTVDGIVGAKTWAALDKDPDGGSKYDVDAIERLMRLRVGEHYIIGAQGHELIKDYLDKRNAAKPAYFTNGRYEWIVEQIALAAKLGKRLYCEDCSGLLMGCNDVLGFWPDKDLTAEGIRKRCKKITRAEVRPGDIAFRVVDGEANHMAWVGNAGLYEAVGTAYGVVLRTDIDDRKTLNQMTGKVDNRPDWTEWGRP